MIDKDRMNTMREYLSAERVLLVSQFQYKDPIPSINPLDEQGGRDIPAEPFIKPGIFYA